MLKARVNGTIVGSLRAELNTICYYRYKKDEASCETSYSYTIGKDRSILLEIIEPQCYSVSMATFVVPVGVALGIFVLGILGISIWKLCFKHLDREYHGVETEIEMTP